VSYFNNPLAITTLVHVLIVLMFGVRIVMRRSAPGVAFAWLFLITMVPFAGAIMYLLVGERRIGPERARRLDSLSAAARGSDGSIYGEMFTDVDWSRHPRAAGVQVQPALPVGPIRSFVSRVGLRLHRKVVVVDNQVAWTGSMNLADPRIFKHGVGEWVDAFVRLRGSVVAPLGATVLGDWMLETGTALGELAESAGLRDVQPRGSADIQVVPSGPGETGDGMLQMLLTLMNSTHEELVLTTPYLVPDDSMIRALRGGAGRGVKVTIIVPEQVDSVLTRHASRSFFDDLLDAGVEIFLYRKGLLHTKPIVVDSGLSMFGSVNLDMRSLWMNYEIALFVYDPEFSERLRDLQQSYLSDSRRLNPANGPHAPFVSDSWKTQSGW